MARIKAPNDANSRAYHARHLERAAYWRRTMADVLATPEARRDCANAARRALNAALGERTYWKAGLYPPR